jgi:hypothetical protein
LSNIRRTYNWVTFEVLNLICVEIFMTNTVVNPLIKLVHHFRSILRSHKILCAVLTSGYKLVLSNRSILEANIRDNTSSV